MPAAAWLEFAAVHLQPRELNRLVGRLVKRVAGQEEGEGEDWDRDAVLVAAVRGLLARAHGGVLGIIAMQV